MDTFTNAFQAFFIWWWGGLVFHIIFYFIFATVGSARVIEDVTK